MLMCCSSCFSARLQHGKLPLLMPPWFLSPSSWLITSLHKKPKVKHFRKPQVLNPSLYGCCWTWQLEITHPLQPFSMHFPAGNTQTPWVSPPPTPPWGTNFSKLFHVNKKQSQGGNEIQQRPTQLLLFVLAMESSELVMSCAHSLFSVTHYLKMASLLCRESCMHMHMCVLHTT